MSVSEIRVNQIRVNQGLGVVCAHVLQGKEPLPHHKGVLGASVHINDHKWSYMTRPKSLL